MSARERIVKPCPTRSSSSSSSSLLSLSSSSSGVSKEEKKKTQDVCTLPESVHGALNRHQFDYIGRPITFTVPDDVDAFIVQLWGGGGSGSSSTAGGVGTGAGGGGGGMTETAIIIPPSTITTTATTQCKNERGVLSSPSMRTFTLTIGAGGVASTVFGANGTNGGDTILSGNGLTTFAGGGFGGQAGDADIFIIGNGGIGGSGTIQGGQGGAGRSGIDSPTGGDSPQGGAGGRYRTSPLQLPRAQPGIVPGGGGAGGLSITPDFTDPSNFGANGANGRAVVYYPSTKPLLIRA